MKKPLLTACVGVLAGCVSETQAIRAAFRSYDQNLRLTVSLENPATVRDGSVVIRLELHNAGTQSIPPVCIGGSRSYVLMSKPQVADIGGRVVTALDERPCRAPLRLRPGEAHSWMEKVPLKQGYEGDADLKLSIGLVYPEHCDPMGCTDSTIDAPAVQFVVVRRPVE
jgi:hypothetical protein